jgi:hypothetical protein
MSKKFGFALLADQAAEAVAARVQYEGAAWESDPRTGDSPIERLFFLALYSRCRFGICMVDRTINVVRDETIDAAKERNQGDLLLQRQYTIEGVGRVDFLIHAYADWGLNPGGGQVGWRRLIIECDGHDFHERTKEQAAKDRARDRAAQLMGFEVFRFTGSELWRDPWGCADQVIEWADRGS